MEARHGAMDEALASRVGPSALDPIEALFAPHPDAPDPDTHSPSAVPATDVRVYDRPTPVPRKATAWLAFVTFMALLVMAGLALKVWLD